MVMRGDNCDTCLHRTVCSIKEDYSRFIMILRERRNDLSKQEKYKSFCIDSRCEHYTCKGK